MTIRSPRRLEGPPRSRVLRAGVRLTVVVALGTGSAACAAQGTPSMLKTSGAGATQVERFWWVLFGISAAVFALVMGLVLVAVARRRRPDPLGREDRVAWGDRFILTSGVVLPALILTGTFVLTLHQMQLLSSKATRADLTIRVTGHLWWWEVAYPNGAVTANEIHIPTGERVRVLLTTDDVIHSFWVPQLQTKTDMIPGRRNQNWLETSTPGRYRGECAQFCGLQHAHMIFFVIAEPPEVFQAWVAYQARPALEPSDPQAAAGRSVFVEQTCAGCHVIRGTSAAGLVGPDLTHLATRQTIAGGTLPDDPPDLAGWISDPQHAKPGAVMPPTQLSQGDLASLVAYLRSLQ